MLDVMVYKRRLFKKSWIFHFIRRKKKSSGWVNFQAVFFCVIRKKKGKNKKRTRKKFIQENRKRMNMLSRKPVLNQRLGVFISMCPQFIYMQTNCYVKKESSFSKKYEWIKGRNILEKNDLNVKYNIYQEYSYILYFLLPTFFPIKSIDICT